MTADNLLIHKNFTITPTCHKLALFDLDDTLIKYLPNTSSLRIKHKNIIPKFTELIKNNFFIAILSNQMDMLPTEDKRIKFISKIERLMKILNVPILFVAALKRDIYRKPAPGMLDIVKQYINAPNMNKSFYCGDAAGRKKDHSDCDLKLAHNMNMRFMTPEMFFENGIKDYSVNFIKINEYKDEFELPELGKYDMIFIYGKGRNSGKTFFAQKYFKSFMDENKVKINCQNVNAVKSCKNPVCFYLDYDENVLRWLKIFCELTDKKSKGGSRKDEFNKVKKWFKVVKKVKFCYECDHYNEDEMKVANLAL